VGRQPRSTKTVSSLVGKSESGTAQGPIKGERKASEATFLGEKE